MSEQWGQESAPQTPPSAKFRADLHRALEESHRQQVARRKVGAQPRGKPDATLRRLGWLVLLLALVLAGTALLFRRPRRLSGA